MRGHLLVFNNGGRYCCGGRWRRDFSVQHADERSSSASAIVAASTLRTPWGRTRPPRHLDRRIRYALPAAGQVCEPGILYRGTAGGTGQRAILRAQQPMSARNAAPK